MWIYGKDLRVPTEPLWWKEGRKGRKEGRERGREGGRKERVRQGIMGKWKEGKNS